MGRSGVTISACAVLLAGATALGMTATGAHTGMAWQRGAVRATGLELMERTPRVFRTPREIPDNSPDVQVDARANRVRVGHGPATLRVEMGPEGAMMSFRIAGLTNPEIVIPVGAEVRFVAVNMDDDMLHSFVVTALAPPYPERVEVPTTTGVPPLAEHAARGPYHAEALRVSARAPAHDYYVCTVHGHAHAGMYGKLTIVP